MTYNVFGGTLNLAQSINSQSVWIQWIETLWWNVWTLLEGFTGRMLFLSPNQHCQTIDVLILTKDLWLIVGLWPNTLWRVICSATSCCFVCWSVAMSISTLAAPEDVTCTVLDGCRCWQLSGTAHSQWSTGCTCWVQWPHPLPNVLSCTRRTVGQCHRWWHVKRQDQVCDIISKSKHGCVLCCWTALLMTLHQVDMLQSHHMWNYCWVDENIRPRLTTQN